MSHTSTFRRKLQQKEDGAFLPWNQPGWWLIGPEPLTFAVETRPGRGGACGPLAKVPTEYLTGCHFKVTVSVSLESRAAFLNRNRRLWKLPCPSRVATKDSSHDTRWSPSQDVLERRVGKDEGINPQQITPANQDRNIVAYCQPEPSYCPNFGKRKLWS
jgi:hypothetical protein